MSVASRTSPEKVKITINMDDRLLQKFDDDDLFRARVENLAYSAIIRKLTGDRYWIEEVPVRGEDGIARLEFSLEERRLDDEAA